MVSDPRCPHCSDKVSSTATWCMHCGRDFDVPVDADTGRAVQKRTHQGGNWEAALHSGDVGEMSSALEQSSLGPRLVGVLLGVVALVTVPMVAPPNVTGLYLGAVVGLGILAASRSTVSDAIRVGGKALAVTPLVLWIFSPLFNGFSGLGGRQLIGPIVYAVVALFGVRRLTE